MDCAEWFYQEINSRLQETNRESQSYHGGLFMNVIPQKKVKMEKVRKLATVNKFLDDKYGQVGTATREAFSEEAYAFFTGQVIVEARKKALLSQEELAKRIGAHKSYISRIETGKTEPKVSTFYRIAAALGLSVDLNPIKS